MQKPFFPYETRCTVCKGEGKPKPDRCETCWNTGVVLTDLGIQFLDFLKRRVDVAGGHDGAGAYVRFREKYVS